MLAFGGPGRSFHIRTFGAGGTFIFIGVLASPIRFEALRTRACAIAAQFALATRVAALDGARTFHGLAGLARAIKHHGGHVGSHVGDGGRTVGRLVGGRSGGRSRSGGGSGPRAIVLDLDRDGSRHVLLMRERSIKIRNRRDETGNEQYAGKCMRRRQS